MCLSFYSIKYSHISNIRSSLMCITKTVNFILCICAIFSFVLINHNNMYKPNVKDYV